MNSCFISKRRDNIESTDPHFRIGIASIASFLRQNGAKVSIQDPHAENLDLQQTVHKILSTSPDIVGLPAYTEEIQQATSLTSLIKDNNPNILTVIGGPHISALPIDTLRESTSIDMGVIGEGEHTVLDIARGTDPHDIDGIVFRDNNNISLTRSRYPILSLDDLPFPAWDLYQLKYYKNTLPVEPLRGCPYPCIFCYRALGSKVRYKSPIRTVDEIEWNTKIYGVTSYRFLAGTFPLDRDHAIEICSEILNRDLHITWGASSRVDTLDAELLGMMKDSGCTHLQIGIESGDAEILALCAKSIDFQDTEDILKTCKRLNISVGANYILGLPYETKQTAEKTFRLSLKLRKYTGSTNYAILVPYPGTDVYRTASDGVGGVKLRSKNWSDYGKQAGEALQHDNFPNNDLVKLQSRYYMCYYMGAPTQILKLFSWKRALQLIKRLLGIRERERENTLWI